MSDTSTHWGGKRPNAGRKRQHVRMEPGTIFLNVPVNFAVRVSRFVSVQGGISVEEASNADALMQEAEHEVMALCGGLDQPGLYPISLQLAQKAQFAQ